MTSSVAAVLFDMDGVLIDSEKIHHRAFEAAMAPLGVAKIPFDVYAEHWSSKGDWPGYVARTWKLDPEAVRRRKGPIFAELLRADVELRAGAREAVERLAAHWPLALATNSPRDEAEHVLERFGLRVRFEAVLGREDVEEPKPAPDAYVNAAAALGVDVRGCVVVEDSEKGFRSALAAGAPCLVVPNDYTRAGRFDGASAVLESMDEVSVATIERAMRPTAGREINRRC